MVRTSDLVCGTKIFVASGDHGFSFFQVKVFTGSVSVLLTSTSLKIGYRGQGRGRAGMDRESAITEISRDHKKSQYKYSSVTCSFGAGNQGENFLTSTAVS